MAKDRTMSLVTTTMTTKTNNCKDEIVIKDDVHNAKKMTTSGQPHNNVYHDDNDNED
jgi:hypothetical protein